MYYYYEYCLCQLSAAPVSLHVYVLSHRLTDRSLTLFPQSFFVSLQCACHFKWRVIYSIRQTHALHSDPLPPGG